METSENFKQIYSKGIFIYSSVKTASRICRNDGGGNRLLKYFPKMHYKRSVILRSGHCNG